MEDTVTVVLPAEESEERVSVRRLSSSMLYGLRPGISGGLAFETRLAQRWTGVVGDELELEQELGARC